VGGANGPVDEEADEIQKIEAGLKRNQKPMGSAVVEDEKTWDRCSVISIPSPLDIPDAG